ncbi:MAG TPA: hypothetical protein VFZ34_32070 [Blastocatellia bacterium]|nr:hypothetical protein [Blastocatellia bacterium]
MSNITYPKNGIVLLTLLLLGGITTVNSWGKSLDTITENDGLRASFSIPASDAHISEVILGKDKKMSEPTDEFEPEETIFAAVEISDNKKTVKVKGRLHIVKIEGQKPGPIPGLEVIVTVVGENIANFQFSKPTKGWPHGKYKFEALLIDESGETIDTESHEFSVE